MFPIRIPWDVELSVLVFVGGCGCPISVDLVIIRTDTCKLCNMVPVSASAAEYITVWMVFHSVSICPLGVKFGSVGDTDGLFLRYKFLLIFSGHWVRLGKNNLYQCEGPFQWCVNI